MTRRVVALFAGFLVLALVTFFPLSLALAMSGLADEGLTARSAEGTIWAGRMADARVANFALGQVDVGLDPLALLTGQTRVAMQGTIGRGAIVSAGDGMAVDNATARLATAQVFAPIPLDNIELNDVSVRFVKGTCEKANGRVRATFSAAVGGLALAQGLSGAVRCDGGALLLPLVSASAMERLNLRIQSSGDYRAEFFVRSSDPTMAATLGSAGFVPTAGGFVLRLTGKL